MKYLITILGLVFSLPVYGLHIEYSDIHNQRQPQPNAVLNVASATVRGQLDFGSLVNTTGVNISSPVLNQNTLQAGTTAHIASITVGGVDGKITISTNGAISSSKGCPAGFTNFGANECWDTDMEDFQDVISSVSAGTGQVYFTTSAIGTQGCANGAAEIIAQVLLGQATGTGSQLSLFLRNTGSSVEDYNLAKAVARVRVADTDVNDFAYQVGIGLVRLNSSGQFDYTCRGTATSDNTNTCNLSIRRLINCP